MELRIPYFRMKLGRLAYFESVLNVMYTLLHGDVILPPPPKSPTLPPTSISTEYSHLLRNGGPLSSQRFIHPVPQNICTYCINNDANMQLYTTNESPHPPPPPVFFSYNQPTNISPNKCINFILDSNRLPFDGPGDIPWPRYFKESLNINFTFYISATKHFIYFWWRWLWFILGMLQRSADTHEVQQLLPLQYWQQNLWTAGARWMWQPTSWWQLSGKNISWKHRGM